MSYFGVPSTGGFSPYRTGASAHLMFSALAGGGVHWLCSAHMGLAASIVVSALAVLVLWGIGAAIGIASHYNILLKPVLLGGLVVLIVLNNAATLPGIATGAASYLVLFVVLRLFAGAGRDGTSG